MKALVTGASGFVGYSVAKTLLDAGFSVKAIVRSPSNYLSQLPVEICFGDLLDRDSLKKALEGCDYLFHVAAHYSLWERDPQILYKVNVEGTRSLFEVASEMSIKKIVYTSSVATIKLSSDGSPVDETSIGSLENMVGHYKRSKFQAEEVAQKMASEGVPITIVNPSAPVGPFDVKPTPTGKITLDFLKRKMPAYVDTGLNIAPVEDVAKGHLLALEKGKIGERYILGGKNLRLIEILQILESITKLPAPKICMPYWVAYSAGVASEMMARVFHTPPAVPLEGVRMSKKYMFFESEKAMKDLGYKKTSVEDALSRAVDWFRNNGYV